MSKTAKKKPPTTARQALDRKEARSGSIPIVLRASLLDDVEAAKRELDKARATEAITLSNPKASADVRGNASKRVKDLERKLARAEAAVEAETVVFEFRAMGGEAYDELIKAHPPTLAQIAEEQKKAQAKGEKPRDLAYNEKTFPPALFAASCVSPEFSEDEAVELWGSPAWNDQELDTLFGAAYAVNKLI